MIRSSESRQSKGSMRRLTVATVVLPIAITVGAPRPDAADRLRIERIDPATGELAGAPESGGLSALTAENSIGVTIRYRLESADQATIAFALVVPGMSLTIRGDDRHRVSRGTGNHTTRLGIMCPTDSPDVIRGLELQIQLRASGSTLATETRSLPHTVRCRAAGGTPDEPPPDEADDPTPGPVAVPQAAPIHPAPRGADAIQAPPAKQPLPTPVVPDLLAPQPRPAPGPQADVRTLTPLPPPPQGCPDPAVVSLTASVVRRYHSIFAPFPVTGGLVEIVGVIRNVGPVRYESSPPMQEAALMWARQPQCIRSVLGDVCTPGGGTAEVEGFHFLGPGQETEVRHRIPWNLADASQPNYTLEIRYRYDPSSGSDDRPSNDDCNPGNNRRDLRGEEITRLF